VKAYQITIDLKSNLHIGSGFGFARLIDHVSIKDAERLAYIPGSTIKGKLRSVCKKIALTMEDPFYLSNGNHKICQSLEPGRGQSEMCKHDALEDRCVICRLFGSAFAEGKLLFTDAKLNEADAEKIRVLSQISRFRVDAQNEVKTNVKLSRYRKISDEGHLFVSENVSKTLGFTGAIYAKEPLTTEEETFLRYGLKTLTHLGGQKSRGLGRVEMNLKEVAK
jgi:CRISPR/Cas system CSM-associated protein Csm3 (group 7 of RAMP superfamily)